ncbi:MAG: hypothetical protein ACLFP8_02515 [Alphaproteobacteria bacterium]
MDIKNIDFTSIKKLNYKTLVKYANIRSFDNLEVFLEKIPQNTSNTTLIMAACVWAFAGVLGLYTTVKMQEVAQLSVELKEASALLPAVPRIQDKPVRATEVRAFVDELQKTYKGLEIKVNSSNINVSAKSTSMFGQFREAIGHVQNGGLGWRVNVEKLCVGKECKPNPLTASLKINTVSVEKE